MPPKNRYNNKKKGSRNGNKPSEKKSAATIAFPTAEADELTAYLDRLSLDVATSKKEGCYHGSSKAAFEKKEYNDAKSLLNTPGGQVQIGMMALYDADFQQYLFAQAIDEFFIFNANTSNAKRTAPKVPNRTVEKLLQQKEDWETQTKDLGRICKMAYFACSGRYALDPEKKAEYDREIKSTTHSGLQSGLINVLAHASRCDCMKTVKREVNKNGKEGTCNGCKMVFPKKQLMVCPRCGLEAFCTQECFAAAWNHPHWPHKVLCGAVKVRNKMANNMISSVEDRMEENGKGKEGVCFGCRDSFPQQQLMVCPKCNTETFCTQACFESSWKSHKRFCDAVVQKRKKDAEKASQKAMK